MSKKLSVIMALCMAAILILTACGAQAPAASTAPVSSEAQSAVPAASSEQPADTAEPVTIEYWCMWNETEKQAEVIKKAAEEYQNDTGNKVDIKWIGRDLDKIIRVELEAGDNATVDICGNEIMKMRANKDYYLDLSDYITKPYDSLDGKTMADSMNPALAEVVKSVTGEGFYGIPYQPYAILFHYNQAHFEAAGVTPPSTWPEFMDVCQKLKDAGFIPMTIDDAYRDLVLGYPLARMKGVDYAREMMDNKEMWKDDGVIAGLKIYEDMVKQGYMDENAASTVWPAGQNEVALGNVSMYLTGTWLPNEVLSMTGPDFRWGGFLFPVLDGQTMSNGSSMFGGFSFNIAKSSKVKDQAFEFITYMISPKFDQMMADETTGIPLSATGQWPALLKDIQPQFDKIDNIIEWGGGLSANNDTRTTAMSEFARLLGGEITAEQLVENMSK